MSYFFRIMILLCLMNLNGQNWWTSDSTSHHNMGQTPAEKEPDFQMIEETVQVALVISYGCLM